jgi:hypothetical protein
MAELIGTNKSRFINVEPILMLILLFGMILIWAWFGAVYIIWCKYL